MIVWWTIFWSICVGASHVVPTNSRRFVKVGKWFSDVFSQIITKLRDTDHSAEIQSGKLETNWEAAQAASHAVVGLQKQMLYLPPAKKSSGSWICSNDLLTVKNRVMHRLLRSPPPPRIPTLWVGLSVFFDQAGWPLWCLESGPFTII